MGKQLLSYFFTLSCLFLFVSFFYIFFWPLSIDGNSMNPTLNSGDRIILSRIAILQPQKIKRGDIVVCKLTIDRKKQNMVKRIIALPNDHLVINDECVYVNDKLLKESYINEKNYSKNINEYVDIILGNDEYFIMGDNRNISFDSRDIGAIKKSDIVGKVLFKWLPKIRNLSSNI